MAAIFAFLHHLAAFTLFAAVVVELISIRGELTLGDARRLQVADMVLGISAGVLLIVGLIRVFHYEKGSAYYFHNWALSPSCHCSC
jgi:putative membrane protein